MCTNQAKFDPECCQQPASQRTPAHAVGCFKLPLGHAMTLTAKASGELRLAHGRAWVTFTGAANDVSAFAGDHFLTDQQSLLFKTGQTVVLEALGELDALADDVYFDLVMDGQHLVTVSSAAVQRSPVHYPLLGHLKTLAQGLAVWLFGRAHAVRALV